MTFWSKVLQCTTYQTYTNKRLSEIPNNKVRLVCYRLRSELICYWKSSALHTKISNHYLLNQWDIASMVLSISYCEIWPVHSNKYIRGRFYNQLLSWTRFGCILYTWWINRIKVRSTANFLVKSQHVSTF